MNASNKLLIVITGPTAVGKTALSIALANEFKTEIISSDSRQFFRDMNIGTAKPTDSELATVRHYFINSHSISETYDAAQFGEDALRLIHKLFVDHDTVILCGGSGLYVKAVLEGFDEIPEVPEAIRQDLINNFESHGIAWLQERMTKLDPVLFNQIDQQNPHRLIRALEVRIATGQSISVFRQQKKLKHDFQIVKIGLELPREILYHRIDTRMDQMIALGLFEEAEKLYPHKNNNALQTVGYQEIFDFMDGLYDREEAIRLLKRNSRRYAKRQMTWFKRDLEIRWFSPDERDGVFDYIKDLRFKI